MLKTRQGGLIVDSEDEFRRLMQRPAYAWPTIVLTIAIVVVSVAATALALRGAIPVWAAVVLNTACSYAAYSVLHEASHGLISTNRMLNDNFGRIGMLMVSVTPFFRAYRFLHMTHHRFTNDPVKDPDYFCGSGPAWMLPIRWMVMDTAYVKTYFLPGHYDSRPREEKIEFWLSMLFAAVVITVFAFQGWMWEFLVYYFIPTRIALFLLAITFDYLPHYPHDTRADDNKYRATANRVGMEWLLNTLFIGHNYHLSHHLYPTAPFYRYRRVWFARKTLHESNDPALVGALGLAPVDEPVTVLS
jgi:beta-carotene hydroxylase